MDKKKFKKQAEDFWGEVKKVAGMTVDGLEKVTKISQIKIDQTKRKYDRTGLIKELGEAVYELRKAGKKEFDSNVDEIIEQIEQIDNKIAEEAKEIIDLKNMQAKAVKTTKPKPKTTPKKSGGGKKSSGGKKAQSKG